MTSSRFNQPWINRKIKQLSRCKKRSFRKTRATRDPADFRRYQKLKKTTTSACKSAYNDYISNVIIPESTSNPKKFWSFINSKKCDSNGVAPLKATDGIKYSDSVTKSNILNDQFSSVFTKDEDASTIRPWAKPLSINAYDHCPPWWST